MPWKTNATPLTVHTSTVRPTVIHSPQPNKVIRIPGAFYDDDTLSAMYEEMSSKKVDEQEEVPENVWQDLKSPNYHASYSDGLTAPLESKKDTSKGTCDLAKSKDASYSDRKRNSGYVALSASEADRMAGRSAHRGIPSNSARPMSQNRSDNPYSRTDKVTNEEKELVAEWMKAASDLENGPNPSHRANEPRCYGNDPSNTLPDESVVKDRPSLDSLDRLKALEGGLLERK